jgi:hypothetical protein
MDFQKGDREIQFALERVSPAKDTLLTSMEGKMTFYPKYMVELEPNPTS